MNSLELVHAAASRGVCEAQLIYGQMHLDGNYVPRNPSAALHWFERAARGGSVMAVNMVGRCLDQGWGVAASPHLAAPWFLQAAKRGLDWGMYNYATLLILGSGLAEDKEQAFFWLRRAAALHHAKSANLLGGFYEDGWVVRPDRTEARQWYRVAAEGGDFRGQFNLARFLAEDRDVTGALHWLRQVPTTATAPFLHKMKGYLASSALAELREFADALAIAPIPAGAR